MSDQEDNEPSYKMTRDPDEALRIIQEALARDGELPIMIDSTMAADAERFFQACPVECLVSVLATGIQGRPERIALTKMLLVRAIWEKTAPPEAQTRPRTPVAPSDS